MEKIISLFCRNYETDKLVRDEVVPGAEWVLAGEGIPTRKFDGTCCMVRDGVLYKRYELRPGKQAPEGFEAATDVDPVTGKQQGWVPVGDGKEDQYHREAFELGCDDATYELVGPKVQGNPERFPRHELIMHGFHILACNPRTFIEIRDYLDRTDIEGIVWHHPDGRMVKIKGKDFGIKREQVGRS